ncbi:MocR-like pyridoxine biosynthesis transcription factor PdxR [Aestuariispira ectoiniformans]|uniref:MocR-like pyridoxine biosynthesis transcription factor PdxR n=1 Tax=Aestuariispira ectoiniformans TaxID=2775080 RepID=UPI00223B2E07|nr:PLP-dependent aminotransferase family protein [Aestuariispira ectoiniformans]
MRDTLFHLERRNNVSIQAQIREMLVDSILAGNLPAGEVLPSCRKLAKQLKVSRNTVVLAYQGLADDGYLVAKERSGFYVNPDILEGRVERDGDTTDSSSDTSTVDWRGRLRSVMSYRQWSYKLADWRHVPYPFLYGQLDYSLFPIAAWRECSRQAMGRKVMEELTQDAYDQDDPELIDQIRTRLLPRRGITAKSSEILVTLGAQNALYLLSSLLVRPDDCVGIENPGYPDARNIFRLYSQSIRSIPVDGDGMQVDETIDGCRYAFVTPSHHFPTTVTMSMERRRALLEKASAKDILIIEDDYEPETNFVSNPAPALKSLDRDGRVVYLGSFSKSLFPGLRLGYIVAPSPLIEELRALRRLMYRHPPSNNQRTAALFLAQGHYDSLVAKLQRVYRERWEAMREALSKYLPNAAETPTFGGTSYWVEGPKGLNSLEFAERALDHGVALEPCVDHFAEPDGPKHFFRLGISSIPVERIEPGVELISELLREEPV